MRVDKNGNTEYIVQKKSDFIKECHWVIKIGYYTGALKFITVRQYGTFQKVVLKWRLWHPFAWIYTIFAFIISMMCHAVETIFAYADDIRKEVTCTIDFTNTKFKRNPLFNKDNL